MPSAFRNQKNLNEWIETDYFRRQRGLRRWRKPLCAAVGLFCLAGVVAAYFVPRSGRLVQAAPVSSAHSLFNDDCSRCHTEAFQTARKVLPWNASLRVVPDHACIQCHDGPAHNKLQTEEVRCATCHHEHRGRAPLARVPDAHCTGCHGDLASHRQGGANGLSFANVHSFNDGHPEIRRLRDPGQLHFNHKKHLTDESILKRLGGEEPSKCVTCHVPDSGGRHMKPINYETHCRSCHPLNFASGLPPARHRVQPDKLKEFLTKVYTEQHKAGRITPRPATFLPLPGKRLGVGKSGVEEHVNMGLRLLLEGQRACGLCHVARDGSPLTQYTTAIAKPKIPEVWLEHVHFGHQAHRMLACTECHAARESNATSDVLLPKLESCQKCHNGRESGARSDCAECHNYHQRPLQPRPGKMTIDESLGNRP